MLLERLRPNPAYVVSRTYDMLAANPGGAQLHPGCSNGRPGNGTRSGIRFALRRA
jgi:MmyB-like transcription regulator ligand binding domain